MRHLTRISDRKQADAGAKDREFQILKLEWEMCERGINRYDGLLFQIRTWSVTVFFAIVAAAVNQGQHEYIYIGMISTLAFWITEGTAKSYQDVFIRRSGKVENRLRMLAKKSGSVSGAAPFLASRFAQMTSGMMNCCRVPPRRRLKGWVRFAAFLWFHTKRCGVSMISGHSAIAYVAIILLGFGVICLYPFSKKPKPQQVELISPWAVRPGDELLVRSRQPAGDMQPASTQ